MMMAILMTVPVSAKVKTRERRSIFDIQKGDKEEIEKLLNTVYLLNIKDASYASRSFMNSTLFTAKLGPDYRRYDLQDLQSVKTGYFNQDGVSFNIGMEHYLTQWFTLTSSYTFSKFTLKRYDGVSVGSKGRHQHQFNLGFNLYLRNFYLSYNFGFEKSPWLYQNTNSIDITRIKMNGHELAVGYKMYVWSPVALDFSYSYKELSGGNDLPITDFKGNQNKFSFKIFWNFKERSQIGIEISEIILKTFWNGGSQRNKVFTILPYYSF